MTSIAEASARKVSQEHSTATVTIPDSPKDNPSEKTSMGSGFIIKLEDNGCCKVMTCCHVVEHAIPSLDEDSEFDLWVRFFQGHEDVLATVKFCDIDSDLAVLDVQLPSEASSVTPTPTTLGFSRKRKIGTDVVLLGYFNPPAMTKRPNAVPGKIVGPLKQLNFPEVMAFSHSCHGIDKCSGSPIISYNSGKALGVFDSSDAEIHRRFQQRQ